MAESNFDKIVEKVKEREGGYVNNPADRGGETNFGISSKAFPNEDIRNLTWDRAKQLYKQNFWDKIPNVESLPFEMQDLAFDTWVQHGEKNARTMFDESGGDYDKLLDARTRFYGNILSDDPSQQVFARGWRNRLEPFATTDAQRAYLNRLTNVSGPVAASPRRATSGLQLPGLTGAALPGIMSQLLAGAQRMSDADITRLAGSLAPTQAQLDEQKRLQELASGTAGEGGLRNMLKAGLDEFMPPAEREKFAALLPAVRQRVAPGAATIAQALSTFASALSGNQAYAQSTREAISAADEANASDQARNMQVIMQEAMSRRMATLQFESNRVGRIMQELAAQNQTVAAAYAAQRRAEVDLEISRLADQQRAYLTAMPVAGDVLKTLGTLGVSMDSSGKLTKQAGANVAKAEGVLVKFSDWSARENAITTEMTKLATTPAKNRKGLEAHNSNVLFNSYIDHLTTFTDQDTPTSVLNRLDRNIGLMAEFTGKTEAEVSEIVNNEFKAAMTSMLSRARADVDPATGRPKEIVPGLFSFAKSMGLITPEQYSSYTGSPLPVDRKPEPATPPAESGAPRKSFADRDRDMPPITEEPSGEKETAMSLARKRLKSAQDSARAAKNVASQDNLTAGIPGMAQPLSQNEIDADSQLAAAEEVMQLVRRGPPRAKMPRETTREAALSARVEHAKESIAYYRRLQELGFDDPGVDEVKLLEQFEKLVDTVERSYRAQRDPYDMERQIMESNARKGTR